MSSQSQGSRIRAFIESAETKVVIIAPFIKVDALRSLIEVLPDEIYLRCVTRWLPKEIAAGVSDPEILELLEERGNFSLFLADRLHAKLYIVGDKCLVGSTNVTLAGLGEGQDNGNIEVLVGASTDQLGVARTLEEISQNTRVATRSMMMAVRRQAQDVKSHEALPDGSDATWFPTSRRPHLAFNLYRHPPTEFLSSAEKLVLADVARCNFPPGLDPSGFKERIRSLLADIPFARELLAASRDRTVTRADAAVWLEPISGDNFSSQDLWIAFVKWMEHYYSDRVMMQEISEVGLRRAQLLK